MHDQVGSSRYGNLQTLDETGPYGALCTSARLAGNSREGIAKERSQAVLCHGGGRTGAAQEINALEYKVGGDASGDSGSGGGARAIMANRHANLS